MRIHAFEFEDQPWFPAVIRDRMTEFLSFMAGFSAGPLSGFADKLAAAMKRAGTSTLIEMGAGGGGPSAVLARLLKERGIAEVKLVLTDLYPNAERLALAARDAKTDVVVVTTPVDATAVPAEHRGYRLMCNAFHHLPEAVARQVLADAVAKRQGIAILELVDRTPAGFLQVFTGLLTMLLASPFVRPFRWSRLLFTYPIPLIPLFTLWDGVVSCLRIYSPKELRGLVDSLGPNDFTWDIGRLPVPRTPVTITYLFGTPTSS